MEHWGRRSLMLGLTVAACLPMRGQAQPFPGLPVLVLAENQTFELQPGEYRYAALTIGAHARLRISGSVTIFAGKLIAESGAVIEYVPGSSPEEQKTLTLDAMDASGVTALTVIGTGRTGTDYPAGLRAVDGADGEPAMSQFVSDKLWDVPHWTNHAAAPGHAGADGADGRPGENAMDVVLHLPGLPVGASVAVEANGGRGGRGQDGGHGGQGGGSSRLHPAANGGSGGSAGSGGRGGDAGLISVVLVVAAADLPRRDEVIRTLDLRLEADAGAGGRPGTPGRGGAKGDTGENFCLGTGCNAVDGQAGAVGHAGASGVGRDIRKALVDVMDVEAYQQYLTRRWPAVVR